MPRIKITPFTYAGAEVVALRDIALVGFVPRVIPAGTRGRIVHEGTCKAFDTWVVKWPSETFKVPVPKSAVQLLTGYEQYWGKHQEGTL